MRLSRIFSIYISRVISVSIDWTKFGDRRIYRAHSGLASLVQHKHYSGLPAISIVRVNRAFLRRFVQGDDSISHGFLCVVEITGFDEYSRSFHESLSSCPQWGISRCFSDGCSMGFGARQFVGFSLIIRHVNGSAVDRKTAFVPSDKPF